MTERVTIPILAERIDVNRRAADQRFDKLEERLQWLGRLIVGAALSIVVAIAIAVLTKQFA